MPQGRSGQVSKTSHPKRLNTRAVHCSKSLYRLSYSGTCRISYVIHKVLHINTHSAQRITGDYRNPSLGVFIAKLLQQVLSRDISLLYENRAKDSVPKSLQLKPSLCRQNSLYLRLLLPYLLHWSTVLQELTGFQLVKKFPAFYGTRRFINTVTSVATCPYPEPARSSPYPHIPFPEDPS